MEQVRTFDTEDTPLGKDYEALNGLSIKLISFCAAAGMVLLALGCLWGSWITRQTYDVEQKRLEHENALLRHQIWQEQAVRKLLERSTP